MEGGGFDVMLLTEMKIQLDAYLHNRLGYNVTCLTVQPSIAVKYQGSVGLVTR